MNDQSATPQTTAEILDATEVLKRRRFAEQLCRLRGLHDDYVRRVENDPWPFLDALSRRLVAFETRMEEIRRAASPPISAAYDKRQPMVNPWAQDHQMLSDVRRLAFAPIGESP